MGTRTKVPKCERKPSMARDKTPPPNDSPAILVPPHDVRAEKALLGSLFLDNAVLDDVALVLHPEDFYLDSYRVVYEAIQRVAKAKSGVFDAITVEAAIQK